jgi:hypothetical protein
MHQYLMSLVSLPGTAPQLWGIPYEQQSTQLVGHSRYASSIYGLEGTSCVPVGNALCSPVPQDTTSTKPCCPGPEDDISGLHLRHGV